MLLLPGTASEAPLLTHLAVATASPYDVAVTFDGPLVFSKTRDLPRPTGTNLRQILLPLGSELIRCIAANAPASLKPAVLNLSLVFPASFRDRRPVVPKPKFPLLLETLATLADVSKSNSSSNPGPNARGPACSLRVASLSLPSLCPGELSKLPSALPRALAPCGCLKVLDDVSGMPEVLMSKKPLPFTSLCLPGTRRGNASAALVEELEAAAARSEALAAVSFGDRETYPRELLLRAPTAAPSKVCSVM
jgi:hypothetical protein